MVKLRRASAGSPESLGELGRNLTPLTFGNAGATFLTGIVSDPEHARALVERLRAHDDVETAYIQPEPRPP